MKGLFGNLFDLDRDGKLDQMEKAMDYMLLTDMTKEEDDLVEEESEDAGVDYDELSYMDEDERRGALEDAGLNLDDYDF